MERQEVVRQLLIGYGVLVTDTHVVYASGNHGTDYLNKEAITHFPHRLSRLCRFMAEDYQSASIEAVVAPAYGGIALSLFTAWWLGKLGNREVLALYVKKEAQSGDFVFDEEAAELVGGKKALIVEDILNTGTTTRKVVQLVRQHKGKVVGVAALCNRGQVTRIAVGLPPRFEVLTSITLPSYSASDCPSCRAGVLINTRYGHGKEFLEQQALATKRP